MILAPHALAGAATAVIFRKHPILAVSAALISHFVLDAIPHWHYELDSLKKDPSHPFGAVVNSRKGLVKDFFKTGVDFGAGLAIALAISDVFFPNYFWLTFLGAAAGALPDFLTFVYCLFPDSPLFYLQWFHATIHAEKNLDGEFFLGVSSQILFSLAAILVAMARPLF